MADTLDDSLRYLKGVGPGRARLLERLGLRTVRDMLLHLPRRHDDRRHTVPIGELPPGEKVSVAGTVADLQFRKLRGRGRGRSLLEALVEDDSGQVTVVWFNQPYLQDIFRIDDEVVLTGKTREYRGGLQIQSPEFEITRRASEAAAAEEPGLFGDGAPDDETPEPAEPAPEEEIPPLAVGRMVPVYGLTEGLSQRFMRRLAWRVVRDCAGLMPESMPEAVREARDLPEIGEAIRSSHWPESPEESDRARRRLVYEEFFVLSVGMALSRQKRRAEGRARPVAVTERVDSRIRRRFPFMLTHSQEKAVGEIVSDIARERPMCRLLQGDVGSGKTVVALYAMLAVVADGAQAAVMVPTEILAEQHFERFGEWLAGAKVKVRLLTSSLGTAERREVLAEFASGETGLVVGTHALLSEGVDFRDLGLVVIDEGHRFGVAQRGAMRSKGRSPHVLVMTATPIPRTIALTLYGDLDVSTIDEMPKGRPKVGTWIVPPAKREDAYGFVRERVAGGERVFVVYPLVRESAESDLAAATEEAERLDREVFPDLSVGLIHGRMSKDEKDRAMEDFRAGRSQILVATVVVEVGIDVPEATVMVIEHADRFGLATLHQLRGRIGRAGQKAYCLLFGEPTTEEAERRLETMTRTADGFEIAEEDLKIRGPGEFFGTRQHGLPELKVADIVADAEVLAEARDDAFGLVEADPKLAAPEHSALAERVKRVFSGRLELVEIG